MRSETNFRTSFISHARKLIELEATSSMEIHRRIKKAVHNLDERERWRRVIAEEKTARLYHPAEQNSVPEKVVTDLVVAWLFRSPRVS